MSPSRLAEIAIDAEMQRGETSATDAELLWLVQQVQEFRIVTSMTPRQFESWRIRCALASKVPIGELAKRLGMGRATLYRRLGEMGELHNRSDVGLR